MLVVVYQRLLPAVLDEELVGCLITLETARAQF